MTDDKLRRRIAVEAARIIVNREEGDLGKARIRAARRATRGWVKPAQFPSETEIRDEIERISYVRNGDARFDNLRDLRLIALKFLRELADLQPRLVGSVWKGDVRSGGLIEIAIPAAYQSDLAEDNGEQLQDDESGIPVEFHFSDSLHQEGASLEEFEQLLAHEYPDLVLDESIEDAPDGFDRFQVFRMLLAPLEQVRQPRASHPEGDALYHSLQVFELARAERPWDEEFLVAALLHDVGKGIDPRDHVRAALDALRGYITDRSAWLIENHHDAQRILNNTIGARAKRRLQQHPDYDVLLLLARCDREGRVSGARVPDLDEALEVIRDLARED